MRFRWSFWPGFLLGLAIGWVLGLFVNEHWPQNYQSYGSGVGAPPPVGDLPTGEEQPRL